MFSRPVICQLHSPNDRPVIPHQVGYSEGVASSLVAGDHPGPDVATAADNDASGSTVWQPFTDAFEHQRNVAFLGEAFLRRNIICSEPAMFSNATQQNLHHQVCFTFLLIIQPFAYFAPEFFIAAGF